MATALHSWWWAVCVEGRKERVRRPPGYGLALGRKGHSERERVAFARRRIRTGRGRPGGPRHLHGEIELHDDRPEPRPADRSDRRSVLPPLRRGDDHRRGREHQGT